MAIKILLAEDDIQLVDMYNRKFELEGFEVKTAEDGQKALETLKDFVPDVILLDIMMPQVTGLEVLEEIKKDDRLKDALVIMLTNLADEKTAEKIYELGATDYLVKAEMTPLEVCNKVKELIKYYKK
jgi:DNA-binding response OmpR family regulator